MSQDLIYKNLKHGIKPQVDYDVGNFSSPSSHSFRKLSKSKISTKRCIPGDSSRDPTWSPNGGGHPTFEFGSRTTNHPKRAQRTARSTFFYRFWRWVKYCSWRIIPVSWSVRITPIYKTSSSAIWKGSFNPILRGRKLTMVINHLLPGMVVDQIRAVEIDFPFRVFSDSEWHHRLPNLPDCNATGVNGRIKGGFCGFCAFELVGFFS